MQNVGAALPEFTLSVTYPRRNFGPNDMQTTFLDLGLAPRAAIVVLPVSFSFICHDFFHPVIVFEII